MLQMCPKLPGHQFVDPPFEEEILTFIRELGYSENIKLLSDVKVDILSQPWRTFGTIINKCLSEYPCNSKKKQGDRHMANDDPILSIMRFIPQHEVVQKYGTILPDNLTNQAIKESEAYKTYYDFVTGKAIPKPKYVRRTTKDKTVQAPKASFGKRIKSAAKVTRSEKKKQLAEGLETLSKIAFAHKGTGVTPGVPDVPTYGYDDEQISLKSSDEEDDESNLGKDKDDDDESNLGKDEDDDDQEDDDDDQEDNDDQGNDNDQDDSNERIDSDNDGDDFVHPKFSTHDEEYKEEDSFDPRVQTSSYVESTDEEIQGVNVEGDKQDEE
ncbi:hypothetical protein Tco_0347468 [Tanacetum coccineum]